MVRVCLVDETSIAVLVRIKSASDGLSRNSINVQRFDADALIKSFKSPMTVTAYNNTRGLDPDIILKAEMLISYIGLYRIIFHRGLYAY